jgi:hypothetical protein
MMLHCNGRGASVYVGIALTICAGCETGASTPAEHFNESQQLTPTPHGRILPDSAEDVQDGKLRYRTEDGSTVEVTPLPNGDDGYYYVDPKRIDEEANATQ